MIINFGSINIDHVYRVNTLPKPGETIPAKSYTRFLGGKGINHSIAIAKAGGDVRHVGAVGDDGDWALEAIAKFGVATASVQTADCATGHAIITVDDQAENQIVIEGGANQRLTPEMVTAELEATNPVTDWVLLQNETNLVAEIAKRSKEAGLKVAYAAAPFIAKTAIALLPDVDLLALNEGEAKALAQALGCASEDIPVPELLITKGIAGAEFRSGEKTIFQASFKVDAVDTTGAGDTFFGSFLAKYSTGEPIEKALEYAAAASAIQVTRAGAATAIPDFSDVQTFLKSAKTS